MRYVACKSFDSSVVLDGSTCITTMQDLYTCLVDPDATELFIRQDFSNEFFTPSGLSEFIKNIKRINKRIEVTTDALSVDYMVDQAKRLYALKNTDEVIYALERRPREFFDIIGELCRFYVSAYSETLEANNKVSTQHLKIASLQHQLEERNKAYNDLLQRQHETEQRLHVLVSRINYQYGHNLNMDTLLDASGNRYDKVLYIKEYSRVHYLDTFIYYLQEILRSLYGVPCRFCVMESFYAYDNISMYKDLVPSWDMTAEDVYSSDIYMAGYQPKLMEDILKNASNIRYLIILDRAGGYSIHVHGDNVETLYCVSDVKDLGGFNYMDRVISYSPDTLNIPHIPDFDSLTNKKKIVSYSSMPITKAVIELMEKR